MNPSKLGYIQKIEPVGTFDGPGIRTVLFLSGCPLRCLYCHNPETWKGANGRTMSAQDVLHLAQRYQSYYGKNGGVTFSGGEPLMQAPFVLEAMTLLKEHGFHTVLDTSGYSASPLIGEILDHTDIVLYDLKAASEGLYTKITSGDKKVTDAFLAQVQAHETALWIRQVLVPGINDTPENLEASAQSIAALKNVLKVEILPYHTLGKAKYEALKLEYPLTDVPAMDQKTALRFQEALIQRVDELIDASEDR